MLKVTDYTYDDLGRLTCEAESSSGVTIQSYSYTYDDYSNRDTLTAAGEDVYTTDYMYNADNRLLTETRTTADSVDTMYYYYDPNGNQTAKVSEHVAEGTGAESAVLTEGVAGCELSRYNGFNQMVETDIDGTTTSYAYFPSGLRASKTVDGTATDFVLDGDQAVLELTGGSITAKYIRGINLICSTIGSATNYYLYNGHGDVVQLANASGMVTKEYDYDAFGNEKDPGTSATNPFRYCGEYYDISSGTYYLRARYYDSTTGRFLAEDSVSARQMNIFDPYGNYQDVQLNGGVFVDWTQGQYIVNDPLSLNLYTYAQNNPIIFQDPSGYAVTKDTPPSEKDGYVAPKGRAKQGKDKSGNKGLVDKNRNIWVPVPDGSPSAHGGGHWDVERPDGKGYVNKYPGGAERAGSGKAPNLPSVTNNTAKAIIGGAATIGAGYVVYRIIRLLPSLLPPLWWTLPANALCP